jgi:regulator of protease activity HflC (stomatin/prohibitin superfamily)
MSGPVVQSLQITYRVLLLGVVLLAGGWCFSNVRQVPSDSQAAVLRFGRIVRVQPAGLLLAWPRPIEQVELLPAPARQMELKVLARGAGGGPGGYLTGDGGQVLLDATLTWRITDPVAYLLARDHVAPALQRLFVSTATGLAAARSIDDFMAVRAVGDDDVAVQQQRQAIRGDLERAVNRRLAALAEAGAPLGVEVTRADLDAFLPTAARPGFDAVLAATQLGEEARAAARTDAARTLQGADRERDRLLASARGAAAEQVSQASVQVAEIASLAGRTPADGRQGLLEQLWRTRVSTVLQAAGSIVAVDPNGGTRLVLPGTQP